MIGTRDAYLYIIEAGDQRIYKIGVTKDIDSRLASLQTGSYVKLGVVAQIDKHSNGVYAQSLEREMHELLAASRISGEWFQCGFSVIERAMKESFVKLYCPPLYARWQRYRMYVSSKNIRKRRSSCCGSLYYPDA
jgi:predicted GIY-YIG superfamily endonuclease